MPPPQPPSPPFPIPPPPPIPIATILTKLKTMRPYLERTTDANLLSNLGKVFKAVEDLYAFWLKGFDPEMWLGPVEEDWDENAVESVHEDGDGSERSRSRDGSRSRSRSRDPSRHGSNGVYSSAGYTDAPHESNHAQRANSDQGSKYQHSKNELDTRQGAASYVAHGDNQERSGRFFDDRLDGEDSDFDHDDRERVDGYKPQYAGSTYSPPPAVSPPPPAVQAVQGLQEPDRFLLSPEPPLPPQPSPPPQSSLPNPQSPTATPPVQASSPPPLPSAQLQQPESEPTFRIKGLASSIPVLASPHPSPLPTANLEPPPVAPQGSRKLRKRLQNAAHSARGENRVFVDLEELGSGTAKETRFNVRGQAGVSVEMERQPEEQGRQAPGGEFSNRGHGNGVGGFEEKEDVQGNQGSPAVLKARNMWDPIDEDG